VILLALPMMHFALSLGAIYAVIPIIIIIILILAARGAVSGTDLFAMFGINTLLGAQRVTNPSGSGKGIAGRPYRSSGRPQGAAKVIGGAMVGHKTDKKAMFGKWQKATKIYYNTETGKPVSGLDAAGKMHPVNAEGYLLDARLQRIPIMGEGYQKKAERGIDFLGFGTTAGLLRQKNILTEDETMEDVGEKLKGKQGDSMAGVLSAQLAQDASDANYKLEKLIPDKLDEAVKYFSQAAGQPVGAELSIMSAKEKRELIMRSTTTKKLNEYFKNNVKMSEELAGTPTPLAAPYKPSIQMSISQIAGFYKEWGPARRQRGTLSLEVQNRAAILKNADISNDQLEGMREYYGLPKAADRSKLEDMLARRLSDTQIVNYLTAHPVRPRTTS